MTDRPLSRSPGSDLLSAVEARDYLGGISGQTLDRRVRDEGLPLVKIRRRSFFLQSDLDALVRASTRSSR